MASQGESSSAAGNTKIIQQGPKSAMASSQGESSPATGNKRIAPRSSLILNFEIFQASEIISAFKEQREDEEAKKIFEADFLNANLEMKVIFDVLFKANNENLQDLIDIASAKIADMMKNKSVAWVKKKFRLKDDLSVAEETEIRTEHPWAFDGVDPDED